MMPDQPQGEPTEPLARVMADANQALMRRTLQSHVVEAAWAARAAYHALTMEQDGLAALPPHLALHVVQTAFAAVWNSRLAEDARE